MAAAPEDIVFWRALFAVSTRVAVALDRALHVSHGVSLAEFEILMALNACAPEGVRMTQLAEMASVSKSRLSHCVDRLVDGGLVRREPVPNDRRGFRAHITSDGDKVCEAASADHARIRGELLAAIGPTARAQFTPLLATAAEAAKGAGPTFS